MHEMKSTSSLTWLAEIADVQRSSYYKWHQSQAKRNTRLDQDKQLKETIKSIHLKHRDYWNPRMKISLQEEGLFVNHKKVYRLMRDLGIQSIIRMMQRFFKGKPSNVYPNVLNCEFLGRYENEVLVTDITYLPFKDGFRYLSVVQDIHNNEIVSWKISNRNDLKLVLETLDGLI